MTFADNPRGWSIGPWWLHFAVGPYFNGWVLYAFRRRIAFRPIDYLKAPIVNGRRVWGFPKIASLDLRGAA